MEAVHRGNQTQDPTCRLERLVFTYTSADLSLAAVHASITIRLARVETGKRRYELSASLTLPTGVPGTCHVVFMLGTETLMTDSNKSEHPFTYMRLVRKKVERLKV